MSFFCNKLSALVCFFWSPHLSVKIKANETTTSVRKDMRINKDLLARIDSARGDVPFAAWVKRAIKMRLDNLGSTISVEPTPVDISADTPKKGKLKITHNTRSVRTSNELRAEKNKKKLLSAVDSLSYLEKTEILNARYPKSQCRKAIGGVVSKDSIAKYWNEIKNVLCD